MKPWSVVLDKREQVTREFDARAHVIDVQGAAASQQARDVSRLLRACCVFIVEGDPVFWSADCARLVAHAAEHLPVDTIASREMMYLETAFIWFEHPPLTLIIDSLTTEGAAEATPLRGLVTHWDETRASWVITAIGELRRKDGGTTLWPMHWTGITPGQRIDSPNNMTAGLTPQEKAEGVVVAQLAVAAHAFMRQRLFGITQESADRSTRRRLERAGREVPKVTVIALRATDYGHVERRGEPGDVDWSCRWAVRGHWRQQYHPSTGERVPKWIHPHFKGPEHLPLRTLQRVFSVTR